MRNNEHPVPGYLTLYVGPEEPDNRDDRDGGPDEGQPGDGANVGGHEGDPGAGDGGDYDPGTGDEWVLRLAKHIHGLLVNHNSSAVALDTATLETIIHNEYWHGHRTVWSDAEIEADPYLPVYHKITPETQLDQYKDWPGQAAQQVQELMRASKGVLPEGIIQSAIRVQHWVWSNEGDISSDHPTDHWTCQAARQIHTALLDPDMMVTTEGMRCWIRDHYLRTPPGAEIEDDELCPDWDPNDWDPNDWDVRATVELHGLIRERVPLTRDDIRFIIIEEYNADVDEDPADFDITEPIEHMDLESGAGTTVNIHAPVDVANFIMGPGSTINVFEPIAEVAVEQENGGAVWFMATPDTSHVQQGPGSLIAYPTCDHDPEQPGGCPGCGEGCSC